MRFKKVYIEITNQCNLNCSFCNNNKRNKTFMTIEQFKHVIKEVKPYTDYVYLHVKGEPLLHPNLKEILEVCKANSIKVNITTNGVLLKQNMDILLDSGYVRQINVSLHSENAISNYFEDVFASCKLLSKKIYINYRLWTLNNYKLDLKSAKIVDKIVESYNLSTEMVEKIINEDSIKVDFNTFVDKENMFEWPSLITNEQSNNFCYGLSTHIGILADGTVVPCCLDGEGVINLGNVFCEKLEDIIETERARTIIKEFKNNKCSELLCQKCSFKKRFNSKNM